MTAARASALTHTIGNEKSEENRMAIEFRIPELGENITEADVAEILVKEGDRVEAEQPVMELETEKAVVELPCPHAGVIVKVHVGEGDTVEVGAVVLTIDDATDASAPPDAAQVAVEPAAPSRNAACCPVSRFRKQARSAETCAAIDPAEARARASARRRSPPAARWTGDAANGAQTRGRPVSGHRHR